MTMNNSCVQEKKDSANKIIWKTLILRNVAYSQYATYE